MVLYWHVYRVADMGMNETIQTYFAVLGSVALVFLGFLFIMMLLANCGKGE